MTRLRTGLAALVLVAACSSGGGAVKANGSVTAQGPASDQKASVRMSDQLRFSPNEVHAKVGTLTLLIDNTGSVPHDLVFDDQALGKTSLVQGGSTATLKVLLTKAGTYRFTCTIHTGMNGEVVVTGAGS
jgi:plastocyanin